MILLLGVALGADGWLCRSPGVNAEGTVVTGIGLATDARLAKQVAERDCALQGEGCGPATCTEAKVTEGAPPTVEQAPPTFGHRALACRSYGETVCTVCGAESEACTSASQGSVRAEATVCAELEESVRRRAHMAGANFFGVGDRWMEVLCRKEAAHWAQQQPASQQPAQQPASSPPSQQPISQQPSAEHSPQPTQHSPHR